MAAFVICLALPPVYISLQKKKGMTVVFIVIVIGHSLSAMIKFNELLIYIQFVK